MFSILRLKRFLFNVRVCFCVFGPLLWVPDKLQLSQQGLGCKVRTLKTCSLKGPDRAQDTDSG